MKRRADRHCQVCGHPKRNHGILPQSKLLGCRNCPVLSMLHEYKMDNLKYLEELTGGSNG